MRKVCKSFFLRTVFIFQFFISSNIYASWESLEEEYEKPDNYGYYMCPIEINAGYGFGATSRFYAVNCYGESLIYTSHFDERPLKYFLVHNLNIDVGLVNTSAWSARHLELFPKMGFLYQHTWIPMKLKTNGSVNDFLFYLEPITNPTDVLEVMPRIGIGGAYLYVPSQYYTQVDEVMDKKEKSGWRKDYKDAKNFLYDGFDLCFIYELMFKIRFEAEYGMYLSLGCIYHPLLFNRKVINNKPVKIDDDPIAKYKYNSEKLLDGGFGTYTANIGVNYNFKPAIEIPEKYNSLLIDFDPNVILDIATMHALRPKYQIRTNIRERNTSETSKIVVPLDRNYVGGISFQMFIHPVRHNAFGLGTDIIFDTARKYEHKDRNYATASNEEYVNVAFKMSHRFIYGLSYIENSLAVNIKHHDAYGPTKENQKTLLGLLYWTPSLNINVFKYFSIGCGLHIDIFTNKLDDQNAEKISDNDLFKRSDTLRIEYVYLKLGLNLELNLVNREPEEY